ncbi:hypothetical protein K2X33_00885 [bacterium]|nr:hypothetical protein [bacterium]
MNKLFQVGLVLALSVNSAFAVSRTLSAADAQELRSVLPTQGSDGISLDKANCYISAKSAGCTLDASGHDEFVSEGLGDTLAQLFYPNDASRITEYTDLQGAPYESFEAWDIECLAQKDGSLVCDFR